MSIWKNFLSSRKPLRMSMKWGKETFFSSRHSGCTTCDLTSSAWLSTCSGTIYRRTFTIQKTRKGLRNYFCATYHCTMIDLSIDWLIVLSIDPAIDWLVDRLVNVSALVFNQDRLFSFQVWQQGFTAVFSGSSRRGSCAKTAGSVTGRRAAILCENVEGKSWQIHRHEPASPFAIVIIGKMIISRPNVMLELDVFFDLHGKKCRTKPVSKLAVVCRNILTLHFRECLERWPESLSTLTMQQNTGTSCQAFFQLLGLGLFDQVTSDVFVMPPDLVWSLFTVADHAMLIQSIRLHSTIPIGWRNQ